MAKLLDRPELLAPAGDEESLRAAVAAGADAVYFGLRGGFDARARADNFAVEDLPGLFDFLHRKGVQGFVTFNTLVFDSELKVAEQALADIARSGADAIIVQDLGAARLAGAVCPELPLHASTQMTVSSPEAAEIARQLGVTRIVLPRELSIDEIRTMAARTDLELECFVHGALCVSWSGRCLTSEALQHRSANRGQCAQSCRMPYELVVDGRTETASRRRPASPADGPERNAEASIDQQLKYLLSPRDLGAWDLLPQLLDAGVSCFKIEGRMKGPEYVANVVEKYRRALDAAIERRPSPLTGRDEEELRYSFSRGFSHGFLDGADHQQLVHGLHPGHRGVLVGRVEEVHAKARHVIVAAEPDAPALKAGDRILFDQGKPEDDEPRGGLHACDALPDGRLKLVFGGPFETTLDLRLVRAGDVVWKAKDAELTRKMKRVAGAERKVGIAVGVRGRAGEPLVVEAGDDLGRAARAESAMPLQLAWSKPLDTGVLREKLRAFGETPFELRRLTADLEGALALPPSELKRLRRALAAELERQKPPRASRPVRTGVDVAGVVAPIASGGGVPCAPRLVPLLRTLEQVETARSRPGARPPRAGARLHGAGRARGRMRQGALRGAAGRRRHPSRPEARRRRLRRSLRAAPPGRHPGAAPGRPGALPPPAPARGVHHPR